jgi:hypothetical protein
MHTYLAPIEKPSEFMMKLAYYFTRRQFGKVLTPLKVHSARLPSAFGLFYGKVGTLDKKLPCCERLSFSYPNRWRASTSVFSAWILAGPSQSKQQ